MRLNNLPNVSQAAAAARPTCLVSKTLLLPKGTIGRRKVGAQLHFLIKPIYWLFQVIGPETGKKLWVVTTAFHGTWYFSRDKSLHFMPEVWSFQAFFFSIPSSFKNEIPFFPLKDEAQTSRNTSHMGQEGSWDRARSLFRGAQGRCDLRSHTNEGKEGARRAHDSTRQATADRRRQVRESGQRQEMRSEVLGCEHQKQALRQG